MRTVLNEFTKAIGECKLGKELAFHHLCEILRMVKEHSPGVNMRDVGEFYSKLSEGEKLVYLFVNGMCNLKYALRAH